MSGVCQQVLAILNGANEPADLARQVHAAFPHTDFLCNPRGELIWFQGPYDQEKHRRAYERSAQYMPKLDNGILQWTPNGKRIPFQILHPSCTPSPEQRFPQPIFIPRTKHKKPQYWKGGKPPLCVGRIGEFIKGKYKGQKGVVIEMEKETSTTTRKVGIGDLECQFKNFGESTPLKLGPQESERVTTSWFARTESKKRVKIKGIKQGHFEGFLDCIERKEGEHEEFLKKVEAFFASGCRLLKEGKKQVAAAGKTSQKNVSPEAQKQYDNLVRSIILELCPDIYESSQKRKIRQVREIVSHLYPTVTGDVVVKKEEGKWLWLCKFKDRQKEQVLLEEYPTIMYLEKLEKEAQESPDLSSHLAILERRAKRLAIQIKDVNPYRNIRVVKHVQLETEFVRTREYVGMQTNIKKSCSPVLKCISCGQSTFVNCTTHDTCFFCGTVVKNSHIHSGKEFREMEDRRDRDLNGVGLKTNSLLSATSSSATEVRIAPGKAKYKEIPSITKLSMQNKRMHKHYKDEQKFDAYDTIMDFCAKTHLADYVGQRAHLNFCKYISHPNIKQVQTPNLIIAACIYLALDKPFVTSGEHYSKRIKKRLEKRKSEPFYDSRQKRPKVMNFKKPFTYKRRKK